MLPWWPDVTIVQSDITIVVPWQLSTGRLHDYLFCYCPLVGILFEVLINLYAFSKFICRKWSVKWSVSQVYCSIVHRYQHDFWWRHQTYHFQNDGWIFYEIWSKFLVKRNYHFTSNLGPNTIEHVSEMELYIFLSTLEKFECWNRTVLIMKYQWVHSEYTVNFGKGGLNKQGWETIF